MFTHKAEAESKMQTMKSRNRKGRETEERSIAFRWTEVFLLLILFQFTGGTAQNPQPFAVTAGVDITLPCRNVTDHQGKCDRITWTFGHSVSTVTLFERGKIHEDAGVKSDRLSVMMHCSLKIRLATAEDAGRYSCTRFNKSGQKRGEATVYLLSVINIEDTKTAKIKPSTTPTIKSTSTSTTTSERAKPGTKSTTTTVTKSTEPWTNTTASTVSDLPTVWWRLIIVAVGLAALMITVVAVIRWKSSDGSKTQTDENTADPEDDAFCTSVRFIKKANSKARVQDEVDDDDDDDDEEGDAVIYSMVQLSSSSAGASNDVSDLYATINKPKK